jgi:hypothetical protein
VSGSVQLRRTDGPVSLHAACILDDAGSSRIRVYAKTTEGNWLTASTTASSPRLPGR